MPPLSTTERGHSSSAYGRSWVTISTVTSSEAQDVGELASRGGVEADDARRVTRILGSIASTVATATRRRQAVGGGRWAVDGLNAPTWSSAAITSPVELGARPRVSGAEGHVGYAQSPSEELVVRVLEHDTDATADLAQVKAFSTGGR